MRQRVEENLLLNEVGLKMRVRETARKNTKIEPDSLTHTQTSLSVSESVSRNSCEHHLCLYLSPSLHPLLIHSAPVHSTFHAFIHQLYHLPTHSFFLFIKSSTSFFSVLIQSPIHSFIHSNLQRVSNIYLIINPCPIPIMPSTCWSCINKLWCYRSFLMVKIDTSTQVYNTFSVISYENHSDISSECRWKTVLARPIVFIWDIVGPHPHDTFLLSVHKQIKVSQPHLQRMYDCPRVRLYCST